MMRILCAAAGLAALLMASAVPAIAGDVASSAPPDAATVPDELQNMVGDWVLAQEDDSLPKCALTFTDQPSPGGWAVEMPDACPAPYPAGPDIMTWNVDPADNSVVLLNADQKVTLKLLEDEDGLYDTVPAASPRLYLLAPYEQNGNGGEDDADD